jgi:PIN domain nuclease of toxin-antitoxin system
MRILLDTHILIWAITTPERLGREARAAILDTDNDILFSAASIWEIAIKTALRRTDFVARPEIVAQEALDIGFAELPIRSTAAARVADLPLLHRDHRTGDAVYRRRSSRSLFRPGQTCRCALSAGSFVALPMLSSRH